MASRQCLVEVNRTVDSSGLDDKGVHAAVIGLARNLARRIDKVGADEAPLNLLRMYQGALTNLQRAAVASAAPKPGRDAGETGVTEALPAPSGPPKLEIVKESALDRIRNEKSRRAG